MRLKFNSLFETWCCGQNNFSIGYSKISVLKHEQIKPKLSRILKKMWQNTSPAFPPKVDICYFFTRSRNLQQQNNPISLFHFKNSILQLLTNICHSSFLPFPKLITYYIICEWAYKRPQSVKGELGKPFIGLGDIPLPHKHSSFCSLQMHLYLSLSFYGFQYWSMVQFNQLGQRNIYLSYYKYVFLY